MVFILTIYLTFSSLVCAESIHVLQGKQVRFGPEVVSYWDLELRCSFQVIFVYSSAAYYYVAFLCDNWFVHFFVIIMLRE